MPSARNRVLTLHRPVAWHCGSPNVMTGNNSPDTSKIYIIKQPCPVVQTYDGLLPGGAVIAGHSVEGEPLQDEW